MISVVVCTYNRAGALRQMLDSFAKQRHLSEIKHELIVIDNNSNDGTATVVHGFSRVAQVKYFVENEQGLSYARNRAINEAKGEFISFLDDDVVVHENWLSEIKTCFEETQADVVGGRVALRFETPPERWLGGLFRKCLSEVNLGTARQALSNGDCLYGANLSFKRRIFESAGRFDTAAGRRGFGVMSGEETQLVRRVVALGGKVVYEPGVFVEHVIPSKRLQWQYFVARADGDGRTQEFLDQRGSISLQFLRVCRAAFGLLRTGLARGAATVHARDSYERKLAEFVFLRQWSFLAARFARFLEQLGAAKHAEGQPPE